MGDKIIKYVDIAFRWLWLVMCSGLGLLHAVLYDETWYNIVSAVVVTLIYTMVCVLSYFALTYTSLYLREQAENDAFTRASCKAISDQLVKEYRAQATYHDLCKYIFLDIYKKGATDIFIEIYLVQYEKKEEEKETYTKFPYMILWFFLRAKHYPTPDDFKRAIFNTIKDAFDGVETNDILNRSSFVKERSLKVFLDQCKEKPLVSEIQEKK